MTANYQSQKQTTVVLPTTKTDSTKQERASGQVRAAKGSSDSSPRGFPSEKMLAAQSPKYHPLPKPLCGDKLKPLQHDGDHVLKLALEHGKGFLSRNGPISISTNTGEAYTGGVSMVDFRRKFNQGCFLLRDDNDHDTPLVLCLQDRHLLASSRAWYIHGRQPLVGNSQQKPVAKQEGVDFYPWYRVEYAHYGATLANRAKISLWNATSRKYEPLLVAKHAKFELLNSYSDERKVSSSGDILFTTAGATNSKNYQHYDYGFVRRDDTTCSNPAKTVQWNLTIAPGVDPVLMICLTAIMEEFVGVVG